MYDLENKTALVTGAGGKLGAGRRIATRLAQEGADVTDLVACDMLSLAIAVSRIVKNPSTKFCSTVVPLRPALVT